MKALYFLILLGIIMSTDKSGVPYPLTRAESKVETLHGVQVADPYRWLEEGDNPEVQAWVEKQNAFTRSMLDKLPGREKIHKRLGELLEIGTIGAPRPVKGKYFYAKRT